MAATASRGIVGDLARAITGDTGDGTQSLANAISSVIAGGAGAVGGLVAGGGNSGLNALNGAAAASALEQYNAQEHMTVYGHRKKSTVPVSKETIYTIFDTLSATPIPVIDTLASLVLVGMDVYDGNYGEAALDGLGAISIGGPLVKGVVLVAKAAEIAKKAEKANELRKEEEQAREAGKAAKHDERFSDKKDQQPSDSQESGGKSPDDKPPEDGDSKASATHLGIMLGENGTQFHSHTFYQRDNTRLDAENPAPDSRPGQIHYQTNGVKNTHNI